jgi:ATP-dependent Clp protease, protease subunit
MNHMMGRGSDESVEKEGGVARRLLDSRTILLSGVVDDKQAHRIVGQLLVLDAESSGEAITLVINSGGGAISSGFAIYDVIRGIQAPVRTIGAGLIASMGVTIFLAAAPERRFSLPNSRYMIHQPLISGTVVAPASDVEINAREMIKLKDRLNLLIAEATGKPLEKVVADTHRDYWMNAEEAMAYGIVGKVVESLGDLNRQGG